MSLDNDGRGTVQSFAHVPYVLEKQRVVRRSFPLVNGLFDYFSVFYEFAPVRLLTKYVLEYTIDIINA